MTSLIRRGFFLVNAQQSDHLRFHRYAITHKTVKREKRSCLFPSDKTVCVENVRTNMSQKLLDNLHREQV